MQFKHIGIAALIAAAGLVTARVWAHGDRIDVFELVMQLIHMDAGSGTGSAGNSDPNTAGPRTGWFDLYIGRHE
jgi:hypothetical protein